MLKTIFNCIKQRVNDKLPEIKDVRIYNGQDVFSEEAVPFMSPTVFIDFTEVNYDTTSFQYQYGDVNVRVMLFHEEGTMDHLEVFDLNTKLNTYLNAWGEWGGLMDRVGSETDTNFDRLYVMNTDYSTTFEEIGRLQERQLMTRQHLNLRFHIQEKLINHYGKKIRRGI